MEGVRGEGCGGQHHPFPERRHGLWEDGKHPEPLLELPDEYQHTQATAGSRLGSEFSDAVGPRDPQQIFLSLF